MFKLKPGQEAFEIVDGPMAGQAFKPGQEYKTVPDTEKHRFKTIKPVLAKAEKTKPTASKKDPKKE